MKKGFLKMRACPRFSRVPATTDTAFLAAMDRNLYGFYTAIGGTPVKTLHREMDFTWISGCPPKWPNFISNARFSEENAEERVREIITRIAAGELPPVWVFGQVAYPANLGALLEAQGFTPGLCLTGMAMNLDELPVEEPPAGFMIRPIEAQEDFAAWASLVAYGWWNGHEADARGLARIAESMVKAGRVRCYLASFDGKPVGTSALYCADGLAGLYVVFTHAEYRGRGIGRATTLAALSDARRMGYKIAHLQASLLGEPVYRRIGFQACGQYRFYHWNTKENASSR
ncbi:MAG: GNAT family N-acetyltransferase [Armatimonadota bacterium]